MHQLRKRMAALNPDQLAYVCEVGVDAGGVGYSHVLRPQTDARQRGALFGCTGTLSWLTHMSLFVPCLCCALQLVCPKDGLKPQSRPALVKALAPRLCEVMGQLSTAQVGRPGGVAQGRDFIICPQFFEYSLVFSCPP